MGDGAAVIRVHENSVLINDPHFSLAPTVVVGDAPVSDHALLIGLGGLCLLRLRQLAGLRGAAEYQNFARPRLFGKRRGPIFVEAAEAEPQLVAVERVDALDDADGRTVHSRDGDVDLP